MLAVPNQKGRNEINHTSILRNRSSRHRAPSEIEAAGIGVNVDESRPQKSYAKAAKESNNRTIYRSFLRRRTPVLTVGRQPAGINPDISTLHASLSQFLATRGCRLSNTAASRAFAGRDVRDACRTKTFFFSHPQDSANVRLTLITISWFPSRGPNPYSIKVRLAVGYWILRENFRDFDFDDDGRKGGRMHAALRV
ncbi:hypothetical protein Trydic_g2626 [Trypoxylus dichotomus]